MIGQRQGKPKEVVVKSFGEEITLSLRPISALEVDAIRRQFPEPAAPRKEVDGVMKTDGGDPDYLLAMQSWTKLFMALKVCRMLGAEQFSTGDLAEQARHLQADFTESEFYALARAANRVDSGEVTEEDTRRAKDRLYPTASGATSPETPRE